MYELSASVSSPDPHFTLNNYLLYKSCVFPYLVENVSTPISDKSPALLSADFIDFLHSGSFIELLLLFPFDRYLENKDTSNYRQIFISDPEGY